MFDSKVAAPPVASTPRPEKKALLLPFGCDPMTLPVKSFYSAVLQLFCFAPQDRHCAVRNDPRCFVSALVPSMDIHHLTLLVFHSDQRSDHFFFFLGSHNG